MSLSLEVRIKQKQGLCLHQIQSLKILEMTGEEVNDLLYEEYLENPLIEIAEDRKRGEGQSFMGAGYFQVHGLKDVPLDIPAETPEAWKKELSEQIAFSKYTAAEEIIMKFMIEILDRDGIYRISIEETAKILGCPIEMVERCYYILQNLEPAGVFSLNIESFLMKQLKQKNLLNPHLEYMVCYCLEDIARGNINTIAKKLHIPVLEAKNYAEAIKTLQPVPINGFGEMKKTYLIPDIVIENTGTDWRIFLNDEWMRNYAVNDYYLKMMQESKDAELTAYFCRAKKRYDILMDGIEQRRLTLEAIAGCILKYQEDYFGGKGHKKPMTMSDIADKIGVNVSTVSRAVKGKYLQAPGVGTVEIRSLFTSSPFRQGGESTGIDRVKMLIKNLIEEEDESSPYSDSRIVQLLKKQDICVARRTVAKYREEMNIPNLSERRIQECIAL